MKPTLRNVAMSHAFAIHLARLKVVNPHPAGDAAPTRANRPRAKKDGKDERKARRKASKQARRRNRGGA